MLLSVVAISVQVAFGASLAIGVVVTVFAKVDTDDHCKYMQIKQI